MYNKNMMFFKILFKYIAPGQFLGRGISSDGVNFKQKMKLLRLLSFAVNFRKTALNSDFIWIFL